MRWWSLLDRLVHWLQQLRRPRTSAAWVELLQALLEDSSLMEVIGAGSVRAGRQRRIGSSAQLRPLELEVAVAADVLAEALSVDSGRFGHRSGALTVVLWNRCGRFPTR